MDFLNMLEDMRTPFLNAFFQLVTFFGEESLFMVVSLIFFWCVNKQCGYYLLFTGIAGALLNGTLKLLFCIPRPWILQSDFTIVESARAGATGYSFPSGHTQSATGLYLGIARSNRDKFLRTVCIAMTLLIAFSRMYLGVHTPADVLVSLGIGVLLVFAAYPFFRRGFEGDWRWLIVPVVFLLTLCVGSLLVSELMPAPATAIKEFSDACISSGYKMVGAAIGFCLVLWLDLRYIRFETGAVWWAQIIKVVGGIVLVLGIRALKTPLLALTGGHEAGNALRYFLMFAICGGLWPLTFRWFSRLGQPSAPNSTQN